MPAYVDEVLADAPLLYWRLGEASGTTAQDSASGAARPGTISGTVTYGQTTPINGDTGIKLSASSGTVQRAIDSALQLGYGSAQRWTVEFWLRVDTITTGTFPGVISTGSGNTGAANGWLIFFSAATSTTGGVSFKANGVQVNSTSGALPAAGTWYHCALVNDGTNVTWYVNGAAAGSAAEPATFTPVATTPLMLNINDQRNTYSPHSYDEVAVYSTALSATRVAAHYAAAGTAPSSGGGGGGGGGSSPYSAAVLALNPTLYLRLGETSGTAAADSSGNGRNGVYSGGYTLGVTSGLSDGDKAATFAASTSGQVAVTSNTVFNQATGSGTAWSIVFRLRADAAGSFPGIIGKGTTTTGWGVFRDGSTGAVGYKNMGTQVTTSSGVTVGTWAHWAITNDGANIRFYKDGTLLTTAAFTTVHATTITTDLIVNKADSYGDNTLDEISLHTTTLSLAQIQNLVTQQTAATGVAKALSGSVTPASVIARSATKRQAASATPSGVLRRSGLARALAGSISPSGSKFARMLHSTFYGATMPTGVLQRGYPRSVSGSFTPAGTLGKQSAGRFFFGTLNVTGTTKKAFARTTIGNTAPTGAAVKAPRVVRVGSIVMSGAPHQLGVRIRSFVGSLTPAGAVKRIPGKQPAGTVSPIGPTLRRAVTKRGAASIQVVGGLLAGLFRRVFGPAGTCVVTVAPATEVSMSLFLRHRAQLVVEVTTRGAGPQVRVGVAAMVSATVWLPAVRQTMAAAAATVSASQLTTTATGSQTASGAAAAVSASQLTATATVNSSLYGFGYTGGGY